jgi:NhaA family Na+:H+ antiporter
VTPQRARGEGHSEQVRSPRPFQQFFSSQAAAGIILLTCAVAAFVVANSPLADAYHHFWEQRFGFTLDEGVGFTLTLHHWVNDGLMAVFFLLVGLEIKRELIAGELASPRQAALPIAAAVGGMLVPAAVYLAFNLGTPGQTGWAIPMATDIAFALGTLALIAPNAPTGVKVFLAALAIVDDMGAVLVIALFYTDALNAVALAGAAGALAVLFALNRLGVRLLTAYLFTGVVLWYFVYLSGIHATIAGVLTAMMVPTRTRVNAPQFSARARALLNEFDAAETGDYLVLTSKGQQEAIFSLERASESVTEPLLRLEHGLHGISAYLVMPVFAFANAGVALAGAAPDLAITLGAGFGLVLGKPLGVMLASLAIVRLGLAALPHGMTWRMVHACAWLAGIGFTMSLFVATLSFTTPATLDAAKFGVLGGSLVAGIVATVVMRGALKARA